VVITTKAQRAQRFSSCPLCLCASRPFGRESTLQRQHYDVPDRRPWRPIPIEGGKLGKRCSPNW
jgi:hypothetical protein